MLKMSAIVFSIGLPAMLALTVGAHAGFWQVCNHTPDELQISIGYAVDGGHLNSQGWWRLGRCGGCAVVLQPEDTADRGTVYLYAHISHGGRDVVSGPEHLCVKTEAYTLGRAENCLGRFKSAPFQQTSVNLNKNFTTNINAPGCID